MDAPQMLDEVRTFVVDLVAELGGTADPAPEDDLFATHVLDSLAVVQLVAFLEQRYGVAIADAEVTVENFQSLSSIVALVTGEARAAAG